MEVYERIRDLRQKLGLSQTELAAQVGYGGRSAISKIEKGERRINHEMLEKYAVALGVTPAYLISGEDDTARLHAAKRFPLLGEIACGEPIFASEEHSSDVVASIPKDADFCLIAKGDSMIGARIYDGDVVFIRKQDSVENGEIAAVIIGDEATLKRWHFSKETKTLTLSPENPDYRPLIFTGKELEQVKCLGKAVAFVSNL